MVAKGWWRGDGWWGFGWGRDVYGGGSRAGRGWGGERVDRVMRENLPDQ